MQHLPPPLLLTSHGSQSARKTFYNLLENRYHTTSIPVLRNKSVLCSDYGWLLLLDCTKGASEGECCLWNPTSLDIIQLPLLDNPRRFKRCFLSKPPTEPDCFLFFIHNRSVEMVIYRVQDNAIFKFNLLKQGYLLVSVVSFQGIIYGIVRPRGTPNYEFVTIHMVGDKFETKPLMIDDKHPWEVPQPIRSWNISNNDYLIESPCGSELLLVTKMSFNIDLDCAMHFRVFRVNVGRMECEELDYLDGVTIFISYYGNGFCRSSESCGAAIKPNSIYFTNGYGKAIYVYDLDDGSTSTWLPCADVDIDPYMAKSYWVDLPNITMKNS